MNLKRILSFIFVLYSGCFLAQETVSAELPAEVKAGFSKQYPDIQTVTWEKVKFGYEAEFISKEKSIQALFTATGELVKTETQIAENELPEEARNYIKQNFPKEKISETILVDAKGLILYEAGVKGKVLLFEGKGSYVGEMNDEDDDEDDEDIEDDEKKEKKKRAN